MGSRSRHVFATMLILERVVSERTANLSDSPEPWEHHLICVPLLSRRRDRFGLTVASKCVRQSRRPRRIQVGSNFSESQIAMNVKGPSASSEANQVSTSAKKRRARAPSSPAHR